MLKKVFLSFVIIFCFVSSSTASKLSPIKLLPPDLKGRKSLMQSLQERKTSRSFSAKKLPIEVLSNLMWTAWACGIHKKKAGRSGASNESYRSSTRGESSRSTR